MADQHTGSEPIPQVDPSKIPPDAAQHLVEETLQMVRRMMAVPKYRAAVQDFTLARKSAGRG